MKERIIGAVILVLFVVLVVPVFLDGPSDDIEIVSERVPLPGQSEQQAQTVVLERDREQPVPAAAVSSGGEKPKTVEAPAPREQQRTDRPAKAEADEPVQEAVKVVEPEPVERKPAATSPAVNTSTTGMWAVQLGSFGNEENAEKLAADLRKQGFAAFLSKLATDSGQLHRVRIGPQKDRESAEAMAARLAKVGQKGQVVPHP